MSRSCTRSLVAHPLSRGSGGAVIWLDAVLTEQDAQALQLATQSLVLRDQGLSGQAGGQLILQPQLDREQPPFLVPKRRGGLEIPRRERGFLFPPHLVELLGGVNEVSGQLALQVVQLAFVGQQAQD